jgi:hypothetical protein
MPRCKSSARDLSSPRLTRSAGNVESSPNEAFDPGLLEAVRNVARSGLSPSTALDLLTRLITEVPAASKEGMEQIKIMDKLINTARAMMETRIKNEEAAAIATKLEEMEIRLERLVAEKALENKRPTEVWHGARSD